MGFHRYSEKLMNLMFQDSLAAAACMVILLAGLMFPINQLLIACIGTLLVVIVVNIIRQLVFYNELNQSFVQGGFDLDRIDIANLKSNDWGDDDE